MLAQGVHLVDLRAALEQRAGDRLLVGERDLAAWQRQQRRPAAGNEREHEIVVKRVAKSRGMPKREVYRALTS